MLQARLELSERRACRVTSQHRSTQRRVAARDRGDDALRTELHAFSRGHPRWGYRRAWATLREEGWTVNCKRVQRLWREEGLRVPAKRRKRQRLGHSAVPAARLRAERPNHVWALDFQFDQTADGRVLKLLNSVDEHTREALAIVAARSITADATASSTVYARRARASPRSLRRSAVRKAQGRAPPSPSRSAPCSPARRSSARATARPGRGCAWPACAPSKGRVLRLMRAAGLLAPTRVGRRRGPQNHDGTITTDRPDELWGTDATACLTTREGNTTVFIAVDHCTQECVGIHAARPGTRFETLEPLRQGLRAHHGGYGPGVAAGLSLRPDSWMDRMMRSTASAPFCSTSGVRTACATTGAAARRVSRDRPGARRSGSGLVPHVTRPRSRSTLFGRKRRAYLRRTYAVDLGGPGRLTCHTIAFRTNSRGLTWTSSP